MTRLVASTQGSFHSRLTWDRRLEAPCPPLLQCACVWVCVRHSPARCLWVTTKFRSERRLPGAPCSVPRHQLQQNLSPFSLYWKWCGLPYRVSNTTPTYLHNFWRCSQPSTTVLKKYIIMTSTHWKSMTFQLLCPFIILFWPLQCSETVQPKCLQALSLTSSPTHVLDMVSKGLKTSA